MSGNMLFAPRTGRLPSRQSNFSLALQGEQEIAAGAVLEPTVGLLPLPMPAQGPGNLGTPSGPIFPYEAPNRLEVGGVDLTGRGSCRGDVPRRYLLNAIDTFTIPTNLASA